MIEQSDSESETSDHPPPAFVPEGGDGAAQSHVDDESIIPINAPEESPPNIPFVEEDSNVASDSASVGCLCKTDKVTSTFQPKQIPICAQDSSIKFKTKQCYHIWNKISDSMLNTMPLVPPTIEDLLASSISKFIAFTANDCIYSGSFTEIFVTVVHPFFLKAKSDASKEDNPNWHQAMNGPFVDNY